MILTDNQRIVLEESNLPLLLLLEAEEINSDDEPDASKDTSEEVPQEVPEQEEVPEEEDRPPSEEEIFDFEMAGTEDKFLQFTLYDKLTGLSSKINILLDNIKSDTEQNLDLLANLEHYDQYLNVLNELIFSVSTATIYKILGQIELELISLLEEYQETFKHREK